MIALDWERDGKGWPNAEASRFVECNGFTWHVQVMGEGPGLLLLHGTGASTHSWRRLLPMLAERFQVVVPDLPGHGFTKAPPEFRYTLPGMAEALSSLLEAVAVSPALAVGHSAGAAILCRMAIDGLISPLALVSLNGALLPFRGMAAHLFPALARLLFLNPLVPSFLSWRAHDRSVVRHLISGMGSDLSNEDLDFYARLFRSPAHVRAALSMMAHWDLGPLERDLPRLDIPLTLVAGSLDKAIPPEVAFKVCEIVPSARVVVLRGLGHLAHEENPVEVARVILEAAAGAGLP